MAKRAITQTFEADEEVPEIDRLAGFPHPRFCGQIFGHQQAQAELAAALAHGGLHHAWIVSGPEGVGKASLAYRFARHLLATPPERQPLPNDPLATDETGQATRLIRAFSHPELLVLRRNYDVKEKKFPQGISVDEVRRLRAFLSMSAEPGRGRMVIVDRADELNTNAANALLKSLEEPPAGTIFMLVTSEPGRLIRTIHSRCRRLELGPLGADDLNAAVQSAETAAGTAAKGEADPATLTALSGGSVRRALQLRAAGGLLLYDRTRRLLESLPNLDWGTAGKLAGELAPASQEASFETFCRTLSDLLGRLVHAASGQTLALPAEQALAARLIPSGKLATFALLWETIGRKRAETQGLNLDRKSFLLEVFLRLEQAARR